MCKLQLNCSLQAAGQFFRTKWGSTCKIWGNNLISKLKRQPFRATPSCSLRKATVAAQVGRTKPRISPESKPSQFCNLTTYIVINHALMHASFPFSTQRQQENRITGVCSRLLQMFSKLFLWWYIWIFPQCGWPSSQGLCVAKAIYERPACCLNLRCLHTGEHGFANWQDPVSASKLRNLTPCECQYSSMSYHCIKVRGLHYKTIRVILIISTTNKIARNTTLWNGYKTCL